MNDMSDDDDDDDGDEDDSIVGTNKAATSTAISRKERERLNREMMELDGKRLSFPLVAPLFISKLCILSSRKTNQQ